MTASPQTIASLYEAAVRLLDGAIAEMRDAAVLGALSSQAEPMVLSQGKLVADMRALTSPRYIVPPHAFITATPHPDGRARCPGCGGGIVCICGV